MLWSRSQFPSLNPVGFVCLFSFNVGLFVLTTHCFFKCVGLPNLAKMQHPNKFQFQINNEKWDILILEIIIHYFSEI